MLCFNVLPRVVPLGDPTPYDRCCDIDDVPFLRWIFHFPALVVDFLPFLLLPVASFWYFRELLPSLITHSFDLHLFVRRLTLFSFKSLHLFRCKKLLCIPCWQLSAAKISLIFVFFCLLH